ncbi:MAG: anthranilate phosphoribosyltransferase [Alphaproteobacteria bacterium]|nr:MAG: anthranilate phosphoribosyltransferase [Alphaproteobacteria bacterium]
MPQFKQLIAKVADGAVLNEDEARDAFDIMMSGDATPAQMGGFLMALRVRGETVDEITGGARVMREKALTVAAPAGALDTCGTGGDASGTYNISTAAAIVLAAAGVPIAKHGNRAMSSKSGSADVLAALGVNIEAETDVVERCLNELGIGFMLAPRHHSAMRHVGPVRSELGTRTIFNLLGPLANPAGTRRQLIGVFDRKWIAPMAEVLGRMGSERVWVIHGSDGLDELTTTGVTHVAEYRDGAVRCFDVTPEDAGLPRAEPAALKGGDADHNAQAIRDLLAGKASAYRDIVLLNAAAALVVADKAADLKEGVALAGQTIDSGLAAQKLAAWAALSHAESKIHTDE